MTEPIHIPVLPTQIVEVLEPQTLHTMLDVTFGLGGHARHLLSEMPAESRYIGLDWDERNLAYAREQFYDEPRVTLIHAPASQARAVLDELEIERVDGLLADWGVSSRHLDHGEWGFSWRTDAPLDMRMNTNSTTTAADLIQTLSPEQLAQILRDYGEERHAMGFARRIIEEQPQTTGELYECVTRTSRHPSATAQRIFQALRIAVNDELAEVESLLGQIPDLLADGGRAAILSFHSLEDRIVKRALRNYEKQDQFRLPHRRALRADEAELSDNPRSRSALLRTITRRD